MTGRHVWASVPGGEREHDGREPDPDNDASLAGHPYPRDFSPEFDCIAIGGGRPAGRPLRHRGADSVKVLFPSP